MNPPTDQGPRPFLFERDTFTFVNELVWQYRFDPVTKALTTFRSDPPPTYYHRCFVLVRSVRQFHYHARFEPRQPEVSADTYRGLIREVISRNPRQPSAEAARVVIPGYDGLRSFSRAQEPLLKAGCGGPWESYFLRSHWRMVFPISPSHQERTAQQLVEGLRHDAARIVHLFRFPHITINHGIVLFRLAQAGHELRFDAYDPNIADHPVQLVYDQVARRFTFPATHYWAGGPLCVMEIYCGRFF